MHRGWYLAVVRDAIRCDYLRLYVGQSKNVGIRVSGHKRNIRNPDKVSFFYHCARQESRTVSFFLLGYANENCIDPEFLQCWMNVGEQFWSTILQTLQPTNLAKWLDGITTLVDSSGLNVALPVHQGFEERSEHAGNGFPQLFKSNDPEVLSFAQAAIRRGNIQGHISQSAKEYVGILRAMRNTPASRRDLLWRDADPFRHDPRSLKVVCSRCKHPKSMRIDRNPTYTMVTGKYVCRRKRWCPFCVDRVRTGLHQTFYVPVQSGLSRLWASQLGRNPSLL